MNVDFVPPDPDCPCVPCDALRRARKLIDERTKEIAERAALECNPGAYRLPPEKRAKIMRRARTEADRWAAAVVESFRSSLVLGCLRGPVFVVTPDQTTR